MGLTSVKCWLRSLCRCDSNVILTGSTDDNLVGVLW